MKKSTLAVIVLVVVALGVGGLFALSNRTNEEQNQDSSATNNSQNTDTSTPVQEDQSTPSDDSAQNIPTNEVEIEDFAFGPSAITIKKGTTVTWTNKDTVQHSVVPDEQSDAFAGSELLAKDQTYSFTFNTAGTYAYHCGPHPNMTGTVTVTE